MYSDVLLHIDGQWCTGAAGATLPIHNPATGKVLGQHVKASIPDLDRALESADRGFRVWRKTPAYARSQLLRRAAAIIRERVEHIAPIITLEQGKPLHEARIEVQIAAEIMEWFAEEARRTYGRVIPARTEGVTQMSLREPVGPVAAFTPWNFPVNQAVRKVSAALAAGCSIILKGPEETPASCAELVRCLQDAGLPPGVLNLVFGVPSEISQHLIPHPVIRKLTFTGSTPVGKQLAALAGQHMKRVTMELGGHAPVLIFDDADIPSAARLLAAAKFRNAGQVCISPTRILVQQGIYERFASAFVEAVRGVKVGDGMADGTTMGPLANERRLLAMEEVVGDAVASGARVLAGGSRLRGEGNFFAPTVLSGLSRDSKLLHQEPFGPVAALVPFDDIDTALSEANRLPYGLGAYAFTASLKTATILSSEIQSGMVSINHFGLGLPEVPFSGVKDSGFGSEGGSEAMDSYLNIKFVTQVGV